jgi:hypothetical protein
MMRADGHAVSTSTVERALRRRGLLLPRGFRADRKSWRLCGARCSGIRQANATGSGRPTSAAVLDARRVPVAVPFRTQHPLGAVVNRPSVWSDR